LIAAIESSDDEISETATKALGEFSSSDIGFKIIKYPPVGDETKFFGRARLPGYPEIQTVPIDDGDIALPVTFNYDEKNWVCYDYNSKGGYYDDCK
jgi:hypothetical protein